MIHATRALPAAALLALLPVVALVPAFAALAADIATDPQAQPSPPQIVGDGVHSPRLELRHWGSPRLLRNPVALWVNDQGVVYTAETERAGRDGAVLDTRFTGHIPNNILADVGLLSVDDRIAQEKEWEAKGYYPKGKFTATADCVRATFDANGDGVADASRVMAKFQAHGDGINSGVMELDGAVYATCIPHLWKIAKAPGADGAYAKESLSCGWGVRLAFYGHDMHGLVQGPDGRIYFSIGDRGFNVKTKEGVHYDMLGEGKSYDAKLDPKRVQGHCRGGVFRCWPDGTGLEMVFEGLRNPQGLAFNDLGELFTGDNNSDIGGDPARFDHLPEYGDGGWRQDVQTFDKPLPNGAGSVDGTGDAWKRGVWLREKMPFVRDGKAAPADPHDPTTPAWQIPPMLNLGNGPSGMDHMPGTGHGQALNDALLMVNYTGGDSQLYAVKATPQGAWHKGEASQYFHHARMTDIKWGPDGQLYASLFGGGWTPGSAGEVLTLRDPKVFADPVEKAAVDEVKRLLGEGMAGRKAGELLALLGHRDQRVRQRAQSELAKRGGDEAQVLAMAGAGAKPAMARLHAVWALWQKAGYAQAHGAKPAFSVSALEPLLADASADIRTQAARVLGDLRHGTPATYLKSLADPDARARFYGAIAIGKTGFQSGDSAAVAGLLAVLKDARGADPVLRHGASWALAQLFYGTGGEPLVEAAMGAGADERVGAVLALRRLRSPLLVAFLADADPQVAAEAARAIYDMEIAPAYPALADMLGRLKPMHKQEAFLRRALEAAAICGRGADAQALARTGCDEAVPMPLRRFALECLLDWDKPVLRERVWGHIVSRKGNDPKLAQAAVEQSAGLLLAAAAKRPELNDAVGKILGRHLPPMTADEIAAKVADASLDPSYRGAMLERLAREAKDRVPASAATLLAQVKDAGLRIRARELLAGADPKAGVAEWFKVMKDGELPERQAALRALGASPLPQAQAEVAWLWNKFETGALDPALGLDMLRAAEKSADPAVAAKAKEYAAANLTRPGMEGVLELKSGALLAVGGDAARGAHAFRDPSAGKACSECHNVGGPASDSFDAGHEGVFPNLGSVALTASSKDPLYLVRAILDPNADMAEGFKAPSAMYDKYAHDLAERPEEVRDLVAYLKTLRGGAKAPALAAPAEESHDKPSAGLSDSVRDTLLVVFSLLAGAMGLTALLTLILERGKAKLS